MTAQRLERDLPTVLDELGRSPYPDYIDDVLATTAQRRQRPAWTFPERWLPMDIATTAVPGTRVPWRSIAVLALLAIVVATTLAIYVGTQQQRLPAPFGIAANGDIAVSIDGDIHLIDPLTGRSTPIVTGPQTDVRVAIAPTGTHVVFEREQPSGDGAVYELVVAGIDGSAPHVVVEGHPGGYESLAWSPDGRSVLVEHPAPKGIWLYDAFGDAAPRQIAAIGNTYYDPFRPPDGAAILIKRSDAAVRRLLMVDLATGQETVLAEGGIGSDDFGSARWSPDGSAVVTHMSAPSDRESQRLFIVPTDGSGARQITDAPGVWFDIDPSWSPEGGRVGFLRYERVGVDWLVRKIAVYDIATGALREVGPNAMDARRAAPNPGDPHNPGEGMWFEWSPDGTSLIAVPSEGNAHPVRIDVATGAWENLDPVITPDVVAQAWQRKALP